MHKHIHIYYIHACIGSKQQILPISTQIQYPGTWHPTKLHRWSLVVGAIACIRLIPCCNEIAFADTLEAQVSNIQVFISNMSTVILGTWQMMFL